MQKNKLIILVLLAIFTLSGFVYAHSNYLAFDLSSDTSKTSNNYNLYANTACSVTGNINDNTGKARIEVYRVIAYYPDECNFNRVFSPGSINSSFPTRDYPGALYYTTVSRDYAHPKGWVTVSDE